MNARRGCWIWAACVLTACEAPRTITAEDVFTLTDCPSGYPCDKSADGASRVTLEACVKDTIQARKEGQFTLTLSSGQWDGQASNTLSVSQSIKTEPCFRPSFITSPDSTSVRVDAELDGFHQTLWVTLLPAELTTIELTTAALPLRAGQQNQVQLRVRARQDAAPTHGSSVKLDVVDIEPTTAQVSLWPEELFLNTAGEVSAQLLTTSDTTRVQLRVRASPPGDEDGVLAVEKTFTLPVTPP